VRMLQLSRRARLAHEALAELLVGGEVGVQQLERDRAAEMHVLSAVDDPHAALPRDSFNPVPRDLQRLPSRRIELETGGRQRRRVYSELAAARSSSIVVSARPTRAAGNSTPFQVATAIAQSRPSGASARRRSAAVWASSLPASGNSAE